MGTLIRFKGVALVVALFLFTSLPGWAVVYTATSGTWAGNSGFGLTPTGADTVLVPNGVTLTVGAAGAVSGGVRVLSGGTLTSTASGVLTLGAGVLYVQSGGSVIWNGGALSWSGSGSVRTDSTAIYRLAAGTITHSNTGGSSAIKRGTTFQIQGGTYSLAGSTNNVFSSLSLTGGSLAFAGGINFMGGGIVMTGASSSISNTTGSPTVSIYGSSLGDGTGTLNLNSGGTYNLRNTTINMATVSTGGSALVRFKGSLTVSTGLSLGSSASPVFSGGITYNGAAASTAAGAVAAQLDSTITPVTLIGSTGVLNLYSLSCLKTVANTVNVNKVTLNTTGALTITNTNNNTSFTLTGSFDAGSAINLNTSNTINLNSQTLTSRGVSTTSGVINGGTSSTWLLGGSWSTGGTFNAGTSTVTYNSATAQNVRAVSYYNLSFAAAGNKTLQGATTVTNNLDLASAGGTVTVTIAGNALSTLNVITPTGTATPSFSSGGILNISGTLASGISTWITGGATNGTIVFNAAGAQTIPAYTYPNLSTGGTGIKTLAANTIVNGLVTVANNTTFDQGGLNHTIGQLTLVNTASVYNVTSGTLTVATINVGTGSGTINGGTGNINISSVWTTGAGTSNFAAGRSTVTYNGGSTQTVNINPSYWNLAFTVGTKTPSTGAGFLIVRGNFTSNQSYTPATGGSARVNGTFTQTANQFNANGVSFVLTVRGDLTANTTGTLGNLIDLTFDSTANQTLSVQAATTLNSLTISGGSSTDGLGAASAAVSVSSNSATNFNLGSGVTFNIPTGRTFNVSGTGIANVPVILTGTLTGASTGTFAYTSASAQTVATAAYPGILSFSGVGVKTVTASISTVGDFNNTSASAGTVFNTGANLTVGGNVSNSGIITYGGTVAVTGNYTNNGFNNTFTGAANSFTVTGNYSNPNNSNILFPAGYTMTVVGTFSNAGSTWNSGIVPMTLNLGSATAPTFNGTTNLKYVTVNYNAAGAQGITGTTYYILNTTGSGAKSMSGGITVRNQLNLAASTTLVLNSQTLTLKGVFNGPGTITGIANSINPGTTVPAITIDTAGSTAAVPAQANHGTLLFTPGLSAIQFLNMLTPTLATNQLGADGSLHEITIGSNLEIARYAFNSTAAVQFKARIANGVAFTLNTLNAITDIFPTNAPSALRYFDLGTGSTFVYKPTSLAGSTGYKLPLGLSARSTGPATDIVAAGTITATTGSTAVTVTAGFAQNQQQVGEKLILSNGTILGTIAAIPTQTSITLVANALATASSANARISNTYRPITITPTAGIVTPTLTFGFLRHSGGAVSSTNVPDVVQNRRANYLLSLFASAGFPASNVAFESNLASNQGDYNANMAIAQVALFKYELGIWSKYAQNSNTAGATGNQSITSLSVPIVGSTNFAYGATGGNLETDPSFTWTNGGGDGLWSNPNNWTGLPAVLFEPTGVPNSSSHFVNIDAGTGSTVTIAPTDSFTVYQIDQTAKNLAVNGRLKLFGNYNLNFPTLTNQGDGTVSLVSTAITGTGSNFGTQVIPGDLLVKGDDNTILGIIATTPSATTATLFQSSQSGAVPALPNYSNITYNFRSAGYTAAAGATISVTTASQIVTGSGFTPSMQGRVVRQTSGAIIGIVMTVIDASNIWLTANSPITYAGGFDISAATTYGPGTGVLTATASTSRVRFIGNQTQNVPAATYNMLELMDSRASSLVPIFKTIYPSNGLVRINTNLRLRHYVYISNTFGPNIVYSNGAQLDLQIQGNPNNTDGVTNANITPLRTMNGVVVNNTYNIRAENLYDFNALIQGNSSVNLNTPEYQANNLRNFTVFGGSGNSRFVASNASNLTVRGNLTLQGVGGSRIQFGSADNSVGNSCTLRLMGNFITAAGVSMTRGGSPANRTSLQLQGSGPLTSDLFALTDFRSGVRMRVVSINRPGYSTGTWQDVPVDQFSDSASGAFTFQPTTSVTIDNLLMNGPGGDVRIAAGKAILLTPSVGNALTQGSGTITLGAGSVLQNSGNINQTGGQILGTGGTFVLYDNSASTAQTLAFGPLTNTFTNLNVSKTLGAATATITSGKVNIIDNLSLVSGNQGILAAAGGNITLLSTASTGGTARIPQILGGSLTGANFTLERKVSNTKGWHLMGFAMTGKDLGDLVGSTVRVSPANNANLFIYNEANATRVIVNGDSISQINGWKVPTSLATASPVGTGFRVFANQAFATGSGTWSITGTPAQGNITVPLGFNATGYGGGGWNLLANPYPCEVTWASVGKTANVNAALFTWNKAISNYQVFLNGGSNEGVSANTGGSAPGVLASSQGFFAKATGTGAQLSFTESNKTTNSAHSFYRTSEDGILRMTLTDAENHPDESILRIGRDYSLGFEPQADADKMRGMYTAIAQVPMAGQALSINSMPEPEQDYVLPLSVSSTLEGINTFSFLGIENLPQGMDVYLLDRAEGITTSVYLPYSTKITGNDNANPTARFALLFRNQSVTGVRAGKMAHLSIYPNPASGMVTLSLAGSDAQRGELSVTDVAGRQIAGKVYNGRLEALRFDASALKPGVYQITLLADGRQYHERLVIK